MSRLHDDQFPIDEALVRSLVDGRFPRWSGLPLLRVAAEGTVNAIYRLGDDLAVRLPLRPGVTRADLGAAAAAAAELAAAVSVPSPTIIEIGDATAEYPSPWSIQTWVDGVTATEQPVHTDASFGHDLGRLVLELRSTATGGRVFDRDGRGGDLPDHDRWMATCFDRSEALIDVEPLRAMWAELRSLPHAAPDVMSHGDLLPGNLLVADGRLAGVLDVDGFGPADPALDLIVAWNTLDAGARAAFRSVVEPSDVDWARGRAWALQQAMGLVWYYVETNPIMAALGRRTIERLLDE